MFGRKKCSEVCGIFEYMEYRLAGESCEEPKTIHPQHKKVLHVVNQLVESHSLNYKMMLQLLSESANLSEFDVTMNFSANRLKNIADELAISSNLNMEIIEETTESVNEVSASLDSSTEVLEMISTKSLELMQTNVDNMQQLQEIDAIKDVVSDNAKIMENKINALEQLSHKVDEIVEGVRAIAEQTNLLALNASIEAARAGEQGRGFAVVAEEIRKLAEGTKSKLVDMQTFTQNIREATNDGIHSVKTTIHSIEEMDTKMGQVQQTFEVGGMSLNETVGQIQTLSATIADINASAQEITAAMNGITEESEKINEMSKDISDQSNNSYEYAKRIGDIDESMYAQIKGIFQNMNEGNNKLSNEQFVGIIDRAIKAHHKWMSKLELMVEQNEVDAIQTNEDKCEFGHFYNDIHMTHPKLQAIWVSIEDIHKSLHQNGHRVIDALDRGDRQNAKSVCVETKQLSNQIIQKLEEIIQHVKDMNKLKESIF